MRTDKLTLGLVGLLVITGVVAFLEQRETNAQLRRQMAELYRKSGHTGIAEPGDSASAGTIAAARNSVTERCLPAGATLTVTLSSPLVLTQGVP